MIITNDRPVAIIRASSAIIDRTPYTHRRLTIDIARRAWSSTFNVMLNNIMLGCH